MKLYEQYLQEEETKDRSKLAGSVWTAATKIFFNTEKKCLKRAGFIKRRQQQTIKYCTMKGNLARYKAVVRMSKEMRKYCNKDKNAAQCKKNLNHMEQTYRKEVVELKAKIKNLERK